MALANPAWSQEETPAQSPLPSPSPSPTSTAEPDPSPSPLPTSTAEPAPSPAPTPSPDPAGADFPPDLESVPPAATFFGDETAAVTRSQERVEDAPGLVVVVGEREIADRGYRTLADLLADVPGFFIEPDERRDVIFARGVPQSFLVVYDGIPLVLDSGREDLPLGEELSLANVRRVEVLRGPGTALWGANAFNGIVNVVSWEGRDLDGTRVRLEGGAADARTLAGAGAIAGRRESAIEWSLTARALRANGTGRRFEDTPHQFVLLNPVSIPVGPTVDGTGEETVSRWAEATGRLRAGPFELAARASDLDTRGALSSYSHGLVEEERSERRRIPTVAARGSWTHALPAATFAAGAFVLSSAHDDRYPLFPRAPAHRFGGQIDVRSRTLTGAVDGRADATWGRHALAAGFVAALSDSRIETDYVEPTTGTRTKRAFERDFRNLVTQVYAHDRILFLDGRLRVTAGASFDDQTDFRPSVNPRAGVVVRVAPGWIAKALYGEAIRTPDAYDLIGLSGGSAVGRLDAVEGNPDLLPEKVRTAELAGEYRRGNLANVSVGVFASRFDDLIVDRAEAGEVRPVNQGRRFAAGVESIARVAPASWLLLHGSWTFQRHAAELDELGDGAIAAAPEHVVSAGATWTPRPWASLHAGVRGASARDPRGDGDEDRIGPYVLADLAARMEPVRWAAISLRVRNLLDTPWLHRNEGVPGRSPSVAIPGDRREALLTVEGRF